jgi:hypothetical protein
LVFEQLRFAEEATVTDAMVAIMMHEETVAAVSAANPAATSSVLGFERLPDDGENLAKYAPPLPALTSEPKSPSRWGHNRKSNESRDSPSAPRNDMDDDLGERGVPDSDGEESVRDLEVNFTNISSQLFF